MTLRRLLITDYDSTLFNMVLFKRNLPGAICHVLRRHGLLAENHMPAEAKKIAELLNTQQFYIKDAGYDLVSHLASYGLNDYSDEDRHELIKAMQEALQPGESYLYAAVIPFLIRAEAAGYVHQICSVNPPEIMEIKRILGGDRITRVFLLNVQSAKGPVIDGIWISGICSLDKANPAKFDEAVVIDDSGAQVANLQGRPGVRVIEIHRGDRHDQPSGLVDEVCTELDEIELAAA